VVPPAVYFVLTPPVPRFLTLYPDINLDISADPARTDRRRPFRFLNSATPRQ
jgi:hypothetical protein